MKKHLHGLWTISLIPLALALLFSIMHRYPCILTVVTVWRLALLTLDTRVVCKSENVRKKAFKSCNESVRRTFWISPEVSRVPEVKDKLFLSLFYSSTLPVRGKGGKDHVHLAPESWGMILPDWKVDKSVRLTLNKITRLSLWVGSWTERSQRERKTKSSREMIAHVLLLFTC